MNPDPEQPDDRPTVCAVCKAEAGEVFPFQLVGRELFEVCAVCRDNMKAAGRFVQSLLFSSLQRGRRGGK